MTDTDILIRCPWCSSTDVRELKGMYTRKWVSDGPESVPKDVMVQLFRCDQCGREFEDEVRGEGV